LLFLLLVLQQQKAISQSYSITEITVHDGLSQGFITAFCQDNRGFMWIGTTNGLNRYDGYQIRIFDGTSQERWSLGNPSVTDLEADHAGLIWVGTAEGLYVLEPESARFVEVKNLCQNLPPGVIDDISAATDSTLVISVKTDKDSVERYCLTFPSELRIAIQGANLPGIQLTCQKAASQILLPKKNNAVDSLVQMLPGFQQSSNKGIYWSKTVYADRSGNIWVPTKGYGARILKKNRIPFKHHFPNYSTYNFRLLDTQLVWMGKSHPNQLFHWRKKSLVKAPWNGKLPAGFHLHNIIPDRNNHLWLVGQHDSSTQILVFDKNAGTCQMLPEQMNSHPYVAEQLLYDQKGNLWVGAHDGICLRYRPGSLKPERFSYLHLWPGEQKVLRCNAMLQTVGGELFIGTNDGLIRVADPNGIPEFFLFQKDSHDPATLGCNAILSLYTDSYSPNVLYIGTQGCGLNTLNLATDKFSHFAEKDGLLNNVVYGILSDKSRKLWLSSNRGISWYDPTTGICNNFQKSDGLPAGEFNTGAALELPGDELLFGSVDGLILIDPKASHLLSNPIPAVVTNVTILGEPTAQVISRNPGQESPGIWKNLRLHANQNNLIFEFAGLDFSNPTTNRYRYRLLGLDAGWIHNGTLRTANYSGLDPGTYTFEVQAATAFGKWPTESARVNILIRAPWYRSWYAYVFYGLLFLLANLWYIRFRERQLRLRKSAIDAHLESNRLLELDTFKNRILTNITHEFRTPLTIILGLAKRLHLRKNLDPVSVSEGILQQGESLINLLNQITELSMLSENRIQLNPRKGYISKHIHYFMESLRSLAAEKNVAISMQSEVPDLIMDFDLNRLRQVVVNLLTNAIRHTPPDGAVRIVLTQDESNNTFWMRISDTGEGISPTELPFIFERFYQSSSKQKAGNSGLGLTLTKDLVSLMGGNIFVESKPGIGSQFNVSLPITCNAPPETSRRDRVNTQMDIPPNSISGGKTEQDKPVVVVIEDNPVIAGYLMACLQPTFWVKIAEDGNKGVAIASEIVPDIVITDLTIPGQNGFEVLRTLKAQEITSHIPIVILSASDKANDRIKGLRLGAGAFLSKPFPEEEMLLVLKNMLDVRLLWQQRYTKSSGTLSGETAFPAEMQDAVQMEDTFMAKIYQVFEEHYSNETFDLNNLCRELGYSKSKLQRKLAILTNQPPMQLLRNYRLEKAYELLQNQPDMNISAICFRVGFTNTAHFSRLFSKRFQIAPSDLRKGSG